MTGYLHFNTVERMDAFLSGLRMRVTPVVHDPRIVIVDIDEASLVEVGRWPWNRDVVARLVNQMTGRYGVAAIGFDVVFSEPDNTSGYGVLQGLARGQLKDVPGFGAQVAGLRERLDYDGLLAKAIEGKPVVLGYTVSAKLSKGVLPKPAFDLDFLNGRALDARDSAGYEANTERLANAAAGAGIFSANTDPDGILRSADMVTRIGDKFYPSLSLATVAVALGARAVKPYLDKSVDDMSERERGYGGYEAFQIHYGEKRVKLFAVGENLSALIEFRGRGGPGGGAFSYVPAADVLSGKADPDVLAGAIVLVGTTAPGINDLRATPVNPEYPGVEVHANLIASILDNSFKRRPDYALGIEVGQLVAAGLVLSVALALLPPLASIALTLAAGAAVMALNYALYARLDWVLNEAAIVLLVAGLFILNMAWGYLFETRQKNALVSRFGEYVAPELVAEMADDPEQYNMDGESRELTVLFVDVRGFTTISEGLSPKALREYINLYLTAMSSDIRDSHGGTLDKYIGDAVMAFWGAPVAFPDHASRAVASALLMQKSAARLNDDFLARGLPQLKIGIGLNTGMMHVGDMGSAVRRAYTVMGDAVNLGSRLEGITKVYGVGLAVGEATRAAAPEYAYRELDLVRVKGKNEPVAIYEPLLPAAEAGPELLAELARWASALALVRSQRWDAAAAALAGLAAASPGSGLYRLYLERVAHLRAHPPGADWDGVTTFETK
ncbi:CHASE2 domain-containing protein [Massilia glaciei]|uniref:Adenylate/guanylate cyclase domain-containing protein n=1 Tax=Massilia glaciei TaxID=1524097 RepID=A0A2U2HFJ3_9BURK|nr:adenylate/guanylate cyclase domain-containing protein [Massilia glaciei]